MSEDSKRFTVSVPQDTAASLAALKEKSYVGCTQAAMLRDLIELGLKSWKTRTDGSAKTSRG